MNPHQDPQQAAIDWTARPLSRATDGGGSADAARRLAESGALSRQRAAVLEALRRLPGQTSRELAERAGLDRHLVGRRLPDLLAAGRARRQQLAAGGEWRWWAT